VPIARSSLWVRSLLVGGPCAVQLLARRLSQAAVATSATSSSSAVLPNGVIQLMGLARRPLRDRLLATLWPEQCQGCALCVQMHTSL
jgi:hypothetical protein